MGEKKEKKSKKKDKKEDDAPKEEESGGGEEAEEPKRAQRTQSNVFALFNQAQIAEFKEAFTMIDQDRDGVISVGDLQSIYMQIGREVPEKELSAMIAESPNKLNFTHFLTLFGDKTHGTDSENCLRDAFVMFDEAGKGELSEEYVKDLLMNVGDQFKPEEMKRFWKDAPIEGGILDYQKFVRLIKRGEEEG